MTGIYLSHDIVTVQKSLKEKVSPLYERAYDRAPRALFPRRVQTPDAPTPTCPHQPHPTHHTSIPVRIVSCPYGKIAKSSIIIGLDGAGTFTPRLCYCTGSRPPTYLRVYNRRNPRPTRIHGSPMAIKGGYTAILPEVQISQICWILTDPRPLEDNVWV